jgi:alkylhydroperoxidase/carboxymuconolactone decarboxylase family protein
MHVTACAADGPIALQARSERTARIGRAGLALEVRARAPAPREAPRACPRRASRRCSARRLRLTDETYYHRADLARFPEMGAHAPELAQKFFDYYAAVFRDGALSARDKSLIALGVAHAVQCPYCIDAYTQDALSKGCDLEQLTEAVHVATAIKGGSALVHGVQMRNVAEKIGM